jgi:adenylate kinase family enzyme
MKSSINDVGTKILVVGVSGSGKTTLAKQVAQLLGCKTIELDQIHWGPNWTSLENDAFREKVETTLSRNHSWTCDGNYNAVRDITWSHADTIVWLDYSLSLVFWRLFCRTMRRIITRETLWGGNKESFMAQFFSKDSLFLWAFKCFFRYKREYAELLTQPQTKTKAVFRFTNPAQTDEWLTQLEQRNATSQK